MATIDRAIAIRDARAARQGETPRKRDEVHAVSLRLDDAQYRRSGGS